jgi:hypothetical protein
MFVTILKVNGVVYDEDDRKDIGNGLSIPSFFKDEEQYDRWFDKVFKQFKFYHLRKNNTNEIMKFEELELELKFT